MKINILTLFPEMFSPLEHSIVGKAREKGLLEINYHNFRENAEKARHVDDEPYGGGQGMLLRAQPIFDAFDAIEKFKGFSLKVAEEDLTDLDEGEFYYHEIIGLDVYENDQLIGQIKEILQPGANDVWVVKRKGKRDLLLPYIPPVVLNIDIPGNRVDVDILEGLDDED